MAPPVFRQGVSVYRVILPEAGGALRSVKRRSAAPLPAPARYAELAPMGSRSGSRGTRASRRDRVLARAVTGLQEGRRCRWTPASEPPKFRGRRAYRRGRPRKRLENGLRAIGPAGRSRKGCVPGPRHGHGAVMLSSYAGSRDVVFATPPTLRSSRRSRGAGRLTCPHGRVVLMHGPGPANPPFSEWWYVHSKELLDRPRPHVDLRSAACAS